MVTTTSTTSPANLRTTATTMDDVLPSFGPIGSAQADRRDAASAEQVGERNPLGMASRISGQLQARQQELEKERKRLRQITPVPIIRRTQ